VDGKPVPFRAGAEELRAVLAGFESQAPPFDESTFPPIERDREPVAARSAIMPALQVLPTCIPLVATVACIAHMVPGDAGARLTAPGLLITLALFPSILIGLAVFQSVATERAYDGSIRKEIAKLEQSA
jgi:hypothetical protein